MRLGELIRLNDGSSWRVIAFTRLPANNKDGCDEETATLLRLKSHKYASKQYGPAAWGHDPMNCEDCYKEVMWAP